MKVRKLAVQRSCEDIGAVDTTEPTRPRERQIYLVLVEMEQP
jgi:hypothetical protein